MDDDFYNYVDVNEMNKFTDNQKYLDKLKHDIMQDDDDDILDINGFDYDKYDESYIAKDIVNKMMKKKIIDPTQLLHADDVRKNSKAADTQLKIELRHQAVKENRERRLKELEMNRKKKLEAKDVELKARLIVQKEESDKKIRSNIEQQLIEQEVQRLRIEMAEQRRTEEEIRKKYKYFLNFINSKNIKVKLFFFKAKRY